MRGVSPTLSTYREYFLNTESESSRSDFENSYPEPNGIFLEGQQQKKTDPRK